MLTRGALDLRARCSLALASRRMSMGPVTLAKLAKARAALYNRCFSTQDVPDGSVTSGVLGLASRILCDDPLPDGAEDMTAPRLAERRSKGPSLDELVVSYRTPIRAAGGRTKEQVWTAGAPMTIGAAVTGGVSDRQDMVSCACRKAVGCQNPQ